MTEQAPKRQKHHMSKDRTACGLNDWVLTSEDTTARHKDVTCPLCRRALLLDGPPYPLGGVQ